MVSQSPVRRRDVSAAINELEQVTSKFDSVAISLPGLIAAREPEGGRIFIDVSPTGIVKPFWSGLTAYRAQQVVAPNIGKWVEWILAVADVHGDGDGGRIHSIISADGVMNLVVLANFEPSDAQGILALSLGHRIKIDGRIKRIDSHLIVVEDCSLLEVLPPVIE
jgi:hypothetical protein